MELEIGLKWKPQWEIYLKVRKAWVQRGAGLAYNWKQRVITMEKKERIKNIIEKNRVKKKM